VIKTKKLDALLKRRSALQTKVSELTASIERERQRIFENNRAIKKKNAINPLLDDVKKLRADIRNLKIAMVEALHKKGASYPEITAITGIKYTAHRERIMNRDREIRHAEYIDEKKPEAA
jgi:hypothetical protein